MFKVGDFVVYRRDVCRIKDYLEKHIKDMDYYRLEPVSDNTLKIDVPVNNKYLKGVLTEIEVEEIINSIPNIEVIQVEDKMLEQEYKRLLRNDDYDSLIKIIKTTYVRNNQRLNNK